MCALLDVAAPSSSMVAALKRLVPRWVTSAEVEGVQGLGDVKAVFIPVGGWGRLPRGRRLKLHGELGKGRRGWGSFPSPLSPNSQYRTVEASAPACLLS